VYINLCIIHKVTKYPNGKQGLKTAPSVHNDNPMECSGALTTGIAHRTRSKVSSGIYDDTNRGLDSLCAGTKARGAQNLQKRRGRLRDDEVATHTTPSVNKSGAKDDSSTS